ncbi:MAG: PaaI family thioesterase [Acidimicrobiia bacterium]|nr:PaaI family thioesterase [Acidimicrobiia bacterium]
MKFLNQLRAEGRVNDLDALLDYIPYARFIGLEVHQLGDEVITELPPQAHLTGNPNLPAVHGGVVGAVLEMTAILQLIHDTDCERLPKTVDVSFNYLRPVRSDTITYGRANVTRQGRRVANVRCELWQNERDRVVANSHGHFVLAPLHEDEA